VPVFPGSVAFFLAAGGLRVKKAVTGGNTTAPRPRDIFSGSKVITEYDNGAAPGSPSREYMYSGGPEGSGLLAKIDSSGTRYPPLITAR